MIPLRRERVSGSTAKASITPAVKAITKKTTAKIKPTHTHGKELVGICSFKSDVGVPVIEVNIGIPFSRLEVGKKDLRIPTDQGTKQARRFN
jgi:hypothetical protein